ncbi:MAG: AMP-binding protein, partial [Eggerthellaceae bacterium]|nr:AMP-binding protein [Eggerthellaceae bacterium]
MLNLETKYLAEVRDESGQLKQLVPNVPDTFNFAYDVIDEISSKDPLKQALIWLNPAGEQHTFTFADITYWSNKTANYFKGLGIEKGSKVLVILRRHYQFWFVTPALDKLGALMVPATFMLKEHDLEYRLKAASIDAIVCTSVGEIASVVENVCAKDEFKHIKRIMIQGEASKDDEEYVCSACISPSASKRGWLDFNKGVASSGPSLKRVETKATDGMLMYFSSGTSGNPKMVLHDAGYAVAHIVTAKYWHQVVEDGIHFTIADTGWGKAVWGKYYGQWFMEQTVFAYDFDRFDAEEILSLIEKYRIT